MMKYNLKCEVKQVRTIKKKKWKWQLFNDILGLLALYKKSIRLWKGVHGNGVSEVDYLM